MSGQRVLAIDTSSAAVLAGVVEVGPDAVRVLAVHDTVNARGHSELLAPSITRVLVDAGVRAADLDAVVAGLGPGPFTGLRVGLVTAAAVADAIARPTYGVCSLDALVPAGLGRPALALADARRHELYWAAYDASGQRVAGPEVDRPDRIEVGPDAVVLGAGARLYPEVFPVLGPGPAHPDHGDYPDLAVLVAGAADRIRTGAPGETLVPLYLRRPDAVPPAGLKAVGR